MKETISFGQNLQFCREDLRAYETSFWKAVFFIPGYKYSFHHRWCYYFSQFWWTKPIFVVYWLYMKHLTYLFGIQTAWNRQLPRDFVIAHFGGITFFPEKCGNHIYLRQGVTVGASVRNGPHPILGNNIEIGANAVIIGGITIGDNVKIGANAVVCRDIPSNCAVAGVPAKIIKYFENDNI